MGHCRDCWLSGDRMWQIFLESEGQKKKVPTDPGGTSQRVVCQLSTLVTSSAPQTHTHTHTHIGSYGVLGHEGGEKDKNGFPVLPELAAANLKLTAAM